MAKRSEPDNLSIRLDLPGGQRFGPGKATLLEAIDLGGSISAAAKSLRMSYPRALKLVGEMNDQFEEPLVQTQHGGADHGGATLSDTGTRVLQLYRELCETADSATRTQRARLLALTKQS